MAIDWPLPLWQVLREELVALSPAPQAKAPPDPATFHLAQWNFRDAEIRNADAVRKGLRHRARGFRRIFGHNIDAGETLAETRDALNTLLTHCFLYECFRDVAEHRAVARAANRYPSPEEVFRFNRYLLERAFPGALERVDDRILPDAIDELHAAKLSALCFSGGGIRSATFGLGVVQALARGNLLDKFHYLSTVSGGGYLGAWLDAWIRHNHHDLDGVIHKLTERTGSKIEPEPDPIFYLRNFSNYLTPQKGLFSIDTWTLVGIYLRNLALNWTIILPLLMALVALPFLAFALVFRTDVRVAAQSIAPIRTIRACFRSPGPSFWVAVLLLGVATGYEGVTRPSNLDDLRRCWLHRWISQRTWEFIAWFLVPLGASFLLLSRYLLAADPSEPHLMLYGIAAALIGWAAHWLVTQRASVWEFGVLIVSGAVGGLLLSGLWPLAWNGVLTCGQPRRYMLLVPPMFMAVFLATATLFIALASWWTDDDDREFWARMGAWMLVVTAGWLALAGLAFFTSLAAKTFYRWGPWTWGAVTTVAGLISTLLSWSPKTPAQNRSATSGLALSVGLPIVGGIAIVGVLAGLAMANSWLLGGAGSLIEGGDWRPVDVVAAGGVSMRAAAADFVVLLVVSTAMGWFVDVNSFSLHGMYRNRLIRAYLGASRGKGERKPNPFTGFDPNDNLAMHELWPSSPRKLLPVVNSSLNLVEPVAEKLAWQERKAESFTVTPLHSGNFRSGYRRSDEYGGQSFSLFGCAFYRGPIRAISLGTATAVSGAAVSPNMGYISSPVLTFLLTLFNVRLGWWLGNPGTAGNDVYWRLARPRLATMRLLDEALGRTTDQRPYVYLSDGGHFENLGLYEMVLRRCRTIVVIDADEDKDFTFQNLGNAIRKIRIDLGINIEFDDFPDFRKRQQGAHPTVYCAVGHIRYCKVDGENAPDGLLLYVKPTIRGDEPADVLNYESSHPDFPHQTTADQWFSESQFESYRALGECEMTKILAGEKLGDPLSVPYREPKEILDKLRT